MSMDRNRLRTALESGQWPDGKAVGMEAAAGKVAADQREARLGEGKE